jgi:acetate kinase
MKILVINSGSSSIKCQVFDVLQDAPLALARAERIGEDAGLLTYRRSTGPVPLETIQARIKDHVHGLNRIVDILVDETSGVVRDKAEIEAVGHRVVHGGEQFCRSVLIDGAVISSIRDSCRLAPLHNPANLLGIEIARKIFPHAPQVAVFDTAFHQTLPREAFLYAIPLQFHEQHGIRRYGFHGTSHAFVTAQAADYLKQPVGRLALISAHLGNGASMAAIKNGKCIDSTMGLTPLAGLVMGTRPGDIDPGLPLFLLEHCGLSRPQVHELLNRRSGLRGLCGTNDMREIVEREQAGEEQAILALEVYSYRFRKYLGALFAVLGSLDTLIFTGGVGENSARVRELCCQGLAHLGIELDLQQNQSRLEGMRRISRTASRVKVLVIPTDEEWMIARETQRVVEQT